MEIAADRFGYKIDRPNTLSGLLTTRAELAAILKVEQEALQRLVSDLGHLDATIRIFDPNADTSRVARHPAKSGARRGGLRRFVLAELRAATEPISSRDIADALIKAKGLDTGRTSVGEARRRVGACLRALKLGGAIRETAQVGEFKTWELTSPSPAGPGGFLSGD